MRLFILLCVVNLIEPPAVSYELSPEEDNEIIRKMLEEHNKYREIHYADPLVLDEKLNALAQACCETGLASNGRCPSSITGKNGQNIYVSNDINAKTLMAPDLPYRNPVKQWYDQIKNYKGYYEIPSLNFDTFTQIVWRSTKRLGCGFHSDKKLAAVCFYSPQGNVQTKNLNHTISIYKLNVIIGAPPVEPLPDKSPPDETPTAGSPTAESPTAESPTAESPTAGSPTAGSPTAGSPAADESLSVWWYLIPVFLVIVLIKLWYSRSSAVDVPDSPPDDEFDSPPEDESDLSPEYGYESPLEDESDSPPEYE